MRGCAHCSLPLPDSTGHGSEFCCIGCRFAFQLGRPATADGEATTSGTLVLRLGTGIFVALNIMVFSWIFYSQEIFGRAAQGATGEALGELFSWLLLFLCSIVLVTLGFPLARNAYDNLIASRPFRPDTNLLICIGVGAAFALSAFHTIRGSGRLYYDTAAMILVIVTLGTWLEAGARKRASDSARALLVELPREAVVQRDGVRVEVAVESLEIGDRIVVRAGETLPADGIVVEGSSHVNESSLTGEFRPRPVAPGASVLAGSVSVDGALQFRAQAVGGDRVVAAMERLLEQARSRQAPIQRIADRVSGWFVPFVVALALTVLVTRSLLGDPARGLFDALSVLLISCPCALGLAAPLSSWQALRLAARRGILIDSAATLERAAGVRRVLFDKTGTLTEPALDLTDTRTEADLDADEALRLAAALEATTLHPIAAALIRAATAAGVAVEPATHAVTHAGLGLEGQVDGRVLFLGGCRFLSRRGHSLPAESDEGLDLFLFDADGILARFQLRESLRPDAESAIRTLAEYGIDAEIVTGDAPGPASAVARRLGIPFHAALLPADKVQRLESVRATQAVAMVGDGINDAPVLAAADVGIAAGSAADLARQAGNVHLVANRLDRVPELFAIAQRAMGRIRLSLGWAFGYNIIGMGLAAAGLLSPVFAASAMVISSLVVVLLGRGAGRLPGTLDESSGDPSSTSALDLASTRTAA